MKTTQKTVYASPSTCAAGSELRQPSWLQGVANCELQFLYIWEDQQIDALKLESSLMQALSLYPAVAGRLANRGQVAFENGIRAWTIRFQNGGVPFTLVENHEGAAKDVPSGTDGPPLGKFADFATTAATKGGPLLTVKLTCFSEGGCILGLTMNHAVFDGCTFGCFMRDWSAIHCGQPHPHCINIASDKILQSASEEEAREYIKANDMELRMDGWKAKLALFCSRFMMGSMMRKMPQARCIIHFSSDELRMLKAKMQEDAGTWLSTNEALLAHMHPLMLDAFNVPVEGKVGALVPVNLRGKVQGIDEGMVGNNVSVVNCVYDPRAGKKEHLATHIHNEMRAKLSESAVLQSLQFGNRSMDRAQFFECKHLKRGTPGVIAQWNYQVTMPFFDVDFGAGKPTRAQPWSCEPVKIMKSLNGGVDVMVWKGSWGIASWAKDRYSALGKGISLAQFTLVAAFLFQRRLSTWRLLAGASVSVAASIVCKSLLSRTHSQYVQACFKALEDHPKLRAFTQQADVYACGGA